MEDLEFRLEDEDRYGLLEYSLENDCDFYLESGDNKKQYAIVSARSWGTLIHGISIVGPGFIIPLAMYNRIVSVYSADTPADALFRWVDYNHIRSIEYDKKRKILVVDKDWYNREKDADIVFLQCPSASVAKATFGGDKVIPSPYAQHGGMFKKDPFSWEKPIATSFAKQTGIKSELTTFDKMCKRAGVKLKLVDASISGHGLKQMAKKLFFGVESNEYSLEDECNYYTESNEDNYTALEQALLKPSKD